MEEELLLVEEGSGRPLPLAPRVLAANQKDSRGAHLETEMHQEMIEAISSPHIGTEDLAADVALGRAAADEAARRFGARAAALATSPIEVRPHPTPSRRYRTMMGNYGAMPRRNLACALHVHVSVDSPEEGVAVLDRIRPWLPVLVALSANSPFADGEDTGHASWRSMAWNQWPCAAQNDVYGTLGSYRAHERQLLATGVLLDAAMLYFPARLSRHHPTVEVRVADVCLEQRDTIMIAALVRALVDTAAHEWIRGVPPVPVPSAVLRLATWQAALTGARGPLVEPLTGVPTPASTVIGHLLAHTMAELEANGDDRLVDSRLTEILETGTGADVQRRALGTGGLPEVVAAAVAASHAAPRRGSTAAWRPAADLRAS